MSKSLDAIFRPKSVAVIGASTKKGSLGREVFDKLLDTDFNGPIYPINPNAQYIHSVKAYATLRDIPGQVDLGVVVVPKQFVLDVVREAAEAGVKGLVVITAGFKETGKEGGLVEAEMARILRENGMRMVGPNCMGVINTEADVRLDTTFAPTVPLSGSIALASQSGALGQTILEHAHELNLGISMFVSVGNKADISGNDLLEYWCDEKNIHVILMYLESFGNPERFVQLAKTVSRRKPIVVVKSGRTSSGARAASSHTGALAGTDQVYDALFRQAGIIRADTIKDMFDFAMAFSSVPLPKGNRVAIISNAGGPGIMAADACESNGLSVVALTEDTRAALRNALVPDASVLNPVDLLAGAQPKEFQAALDLVLRDANVDAAIVIFVAPIITNPIEVAAQIATVTQSFEKPVLGCFMGVKGVAKGIEELHKWRIPAYPFPESAARSLTAMVDYSSWLSSPKGEIKRFSVDKEAPAEIIENTIAEGRNQLSFSECRRILEAYGIPLISTRMGNSLEELLAAEDCFHFPVVLKCSGETLIHKTEHGAVRLNIDSVAELTQAYDEICASLHQNKIARESVSFLVQPMVPHGREAVIGLNRTDDLGALVMFGSGGVYVEVLQDVAFRIAPLTDADAGQMLREIRGYPILAGVRGEESVAMELIIEVLLRVSQLSIDFPQICELDLNPFLLFSDREKCCAVDVRIKVDTKEN